MKSLLILLLLLLGASAYAQPGPRIVLIQGTGSTLITNVPGHVYTLPAAGGGGSVTNFGVAAGTNIVAGTNGTEIKINGLSNDAIKTLATNVVNQNSVLPARAVNTTAPLTGGGALSSDLTLGASVFGASGGSHSTGIVPDPGASAGTTKFLREDASWQVPAGGGSGVSVAAGTNIVAVTNSGLVTVSVSSSVGLAGGLTSASVTVTGASPGVIQLNDANGNLRAQLGTNDNLLLTNVAGSVIQGTNGQVTITNNGTTLSMIVLQGKTGLATNFFEVWSNGTLIASIKSNGNYRAQAGLATDVAYGTIGNPTNGIYFAKTNSVNVANNGTNALSVTNGHTMVVGNLTVGGLLTNLTADRIWFNTLNAGNGLTLPLLGDAGDFPTVSRIETGSANTFLRGSDFTLVTPPTFIASGASHAVGYVPDPGSSAGTTKFLREDATWQVPAGGSGGGFTGNANQFETANSVTNIKSGALVTNFVIYGNGDYGLTLHSGGWQSTNDATHMWSTFTNGSIEITNANKAAGGHYIRTNGNWGPLEYSGTNGGGITRDAINATNMFEVDYPGMAAQVPGFNLDTNGVFWARTYRGDGSQLTGISGGSVSFAVMTNAVLNTANTNKSGGIQQLCGLAWNHVAAVNGRSALDLMADQNGGTTFVRLSGAAIATVTALTIVMDYTNAFCAYLSNNATWYLTNSSAGSGNDAGIVSGTFQDATIGGSGTVTSVGASGPTGFTWSSPITSSGTLTATTPSEVLTNGATQNIALGGGVTNNSAAGFNGNGVGLTNVWVRQVLSWSTPNTAAISATTKYTGCGYDFGTVSSTEPGHAMFIPSGGYLSNFVAGKQALIAATTNIVFTIRTNIYATTMVASLLTCTLKGETGVTWTNDATHSALWLPAGVAASISIVGSATLANDMYGGTVEWWHQSP